MRDREKETGREGGRDRGSSQVQKQCVLALGDLTDSTVAFAFQAMVYNEK